MQRSLAYATNEGSTNFTNNYEDINMEIFLLILTMIAVAFITTFTMLGILLTWEIIFPSDVLLADIIRHFTKGEK